MDKKKNKSRLFKSTVTHHNIDWVILHEVELDVRVSATHQSNVHYLCILPLLIDQCYSLLYVSFSAFFKCIINLNEGFHSAGAPPGKTDFDTVSKRRGPADEWVQVIRNVNAWTLKGHLSLFLYLSNFFSCIALFNTTVWKTSADLHCSDVHSGFLGGVLVGNQNVKIQLAVKCL